MSFVTMAIMTQHIMMTIILVCDHGNHDPAYHKHDLGLLENCLTTLDDPAEPHPRALDQVLSRPEAAPWPPALGGCLILGHPAILCRLQRPEASRVLIQHPVPAHVQQPKAQTTTPSQAKLPVAWMTHASAW